ncbi:MAG TPA: 50S ribosomal protein L25/general stress protein Ctc, partial [Chitinophagales bacterium]|nr:50S ribosomal protein L25/general stress protein Ctc [Chitinophagales bacterium]
MKSLTLEAKQREQLGGKYAAQIRREGFIPCVLYGGSETIHFYAPYNAFRNIVYNPEFFTVNITINGKVYNTLLKEVQFHPVTDKILHLDFLELAPDKKVTAEIPVKLVGQAAGVKAGGILDQKLKRLKVKALPKDLVEHVEINVETLELGKSVKVGEVKIANVEILNPSYMPIAASYIPRVVEEVPAA